MFAIKNIDLIMKKIAWLHTFWVQSKCVTDATKPVDISNRLFKYTIKCIVSPFLCIVKDIIEKRILTAIIRRILTFLLSLYYQRVFIFIFTLISYLCTHFYFCAVVGSSVIKNIIIKKIHCKYFIVIYKFESQNKNIL